MKQVALSVKYTQKSIDRLDSVSGELMMTRAALMRKVIEWFTEQPREVQRDVLFPVEPPAESEA